MIDEPLTAAGPGRGLDHVPSYWADTAGPAPPDDGPVPGPTQTTIAIIGGGYTGLSCALHLARMGARPVLLEANRPAWGCSGRNGGFCRPAIGRVPLAQWVPRFGEEGARALFRESLEAVRTVRGLVRDGDIDCDAQPPGTLRIAHAPSRVRTLENDQRLLERLFDYRTELLGPEEIAARHFAGAEACAALRSPDGFALHPLKLGHGLVRMARAAGAVIHSSSPVTEWHKDGRVHTLLTPSGQVRAQTLVLATNGYTTERVLGCLAGRLLPVLSNIVVTRPLSAAEQAASRLVTTDCLYDTRHLLNYFRRLPDGRVMLGCRGPIRPGEAANAQHRRALVDSVRRKFPALGAISADYFWGGWVAISLDMMPRIAYAADDPSVHYAAGYCGSGVAAAIHAGRRLAERLAGAGSPLPLLRSSLAPYPFPGLRRAGQRLAFVWYRMLDARR